VYRCGEQYHHWSVCGQERRYSDGDRSGKASDQQHPVHAYEFGRGEYSSPPLRIFPLPAASLADKDTSQINLKFINRYTDTWPAGIAAVKGTLMDLKPLVSHVFALEKAVDAMHICADLSQGSIKVQIVDEVDINPEDVE